MVVYYSQHLDTLKRWGIILDSYFKLTAKTLERYTIVDVVKKFNTHHGEEEVVEKLHMMYTNRYNIDLNI